MNQDLGTVAFGLAASLSWGAGDFSGGLATRRVNVFSVVLAAHAIGLVLLVALALVWSEPLPSTLDIVWGGTAGLAGAVGLAAFYRALAVGRMGITAPITAVLAASVPVIFSAFFEGLPGLLQLESRRKRAVVFEPAQDSRDLGYRYARAGTPHSQRWRAARYCRDGRNACRPIGFRSQTIAEHGGAGIGRPRYLHEAVRVGQGLRRSRHLSLVGANGRIRRRRGDSEAPRCGLRLRD